ncbi:hypothetical protein [Cyanobacterium sp. Dongsha4]|uniref:hypothetical protein n=1 Tax=Cyanobacterium sp. DS4 TaxID=2878255 RepID=UPI002E820EF9|nr:hypothetical protein [Cyanobacterium sp. Dongsha4]WVL00484.1 hypothetical protein Dongsha4_17830 [Cyanobacterium sp. Dongsha4]
MVELKIFPSHYKGEQTRQNIIKFLSENNGKNPEQIALAINKSVVQTKRQLSKLLSVGAIVKRDNLYFITPKAHNVNITDYWY